MESRARAAQLDLAAQEAEAACQSQLELQQRLADLRSECESKCAELGDHYQAELSCLRGFVESKAEVLREAAAECDRLDKELAEAHALVHCLQQSRG